MSEDTLHALRDCLETRLLWIHLVPSAFLHKFFTLNLKDRIDWNLKNTDLC